MEKLKITIIEGTTRKGRKSIHAANLILEVAQSMEEVEATLVDPRDYHFSGDGNDPINKDPRYSKITLESDGFFVVVPEYNHSFPGSLKMLLDSELKNYIHKPVAFASVSAGPWGGIRATENLVPAVREMGLVATSTDVQFPSIGKIFNEDGELQDDKYKERIKRSLTELIWMAKTLKHGRENI
jgi:NAD(P)H-dependent FMN reductase